MNLILDLPDIKLLNKQTKKAVASVHEEAVIIHKAGRWKKVLTVHRSIKKLQASRNLSVFVSFRMNKTTMY